MLDVMFDIPSQRGVKEVVINDRAVLKKEPPLVVMGNPEELPAPPQDGVRQIESKPS